MTLEKFIEENKELIDSISGGKCKTDNERRLWVINNEDLYYKALNVGVRIWVQNFAQS